MHHDRCPDVGWHDIAYRAANGSVGYRWEVFWERLDPLVVGSRILPVLVLDNVDFVFVKDASIGKYGQSLAPDDLQEYSGFIHELVSRVVGRYGREKASSFWWRIATEPNTGRGGTGQDVEAAPRDKIDTYVNYYVAVSKAIQAVLPGATVGPGNFASWWQTGMGAPTLRRRRRNAAVAPRLAVCPSQPTHLCTLMLKNSQLPRSRRH